VIFLAVELRCMRAGVPAGDNWSQSWCWRGSRASSSDAGRQHVLRATVLRFLATRRTREVLASIMSLDCMLLSFKALTLLVLQCVNHYFTSGWSAQYCDQHVCMSSVCLSVHSHVSKTTRPNFTKCSVHVTCGCGSVLLPRMAVRYIMYFQFCRWCNDFI